MSIEPQFGEQVSPIPDHTADARQREVELTVLMPCLNEAETLGTCIRKALAFIERYQIRGEILIADNGSTDGSVELALELGARVVHVSTRGYGAALIGGIEAARGRYIIMGDSDDSYDFSRLDRLVDALRAGSDFVIGNRFLGGVAPGAMPALHRYLGNPVLSFIGRLFFRTPIGDFHCGLRGFSQEAARRLRLQSSGMEFASEMIVKAAMAGLEMAEVPVTLSPDGRSRPPHLRSWRDGWRHLKLLLAYAPHWLFLYPGLVLSFAGLAVFAALAAGPLTIAGVSFDVATMVLALAGVLTGAQLLTFYALAHMNAANYGLLPETPAISRLRKLITIDRAGVVGGGLILLGLTAAGFAVFDWIGTGLGDMDPSAIVRPAVLAVLGLALGIQIITSAFIWEILNQRRH